MTDKPDDRDAPSPDRLVNAGSARANRSAGGYTMERIGREPAAWRRTGSTVIVARVAAPDESITLEGMSALVWLRLDDAPTRAELMQRISADVSGADVSGADVSAANVGAVNVRGGEGGSLAVDDLDSLVDIALGQLEHWQLVGGPSS